MRLDELEYYITFYLTFLKTHNLLNNLFKVPIWSVFLVLCFAMLGLKPRGSSKPSKHSMFFRATTPTPIYTSNDWTKHLRKPMLGV